VQDQYQSYQDCIYDTLQGEVSSDVITTVLQNGANGQSTSFTDVGWTTFSAIVNAQAACFAANAGAGLSPNLPTGIPNVQPIPSWADWFSSK